ALSTPSQEKSTPLAIILRQGKMLVDHGYTDILVVLE
ncbi:MAG: hypothetical protein ACI8RD_012184, partial [Bacillariaceae sp.]